MTFVQGPHRGDETDGLPFPASLLDESPKCHQFLDVFHPASVPLLMPSPHHPCHRDPSPSLSSRAKRGICSNCFEPPRAARDRLRQGSALILPDRSRFLVAALLG